MGTAINMTENGTYDSDLDEMLESGSFQPASMPTQEAVRHRPSARADRGAGMKFSSPPSWYRRSVHTPALGIYEFLKGTKKTEKRIYQPWEVERLRKKAVKSTRFLALLIVMMMAAITLVTLGASFVLRNCVQQIDDCRDSVAQLAR